MPSAFVFGIETQGNFIRKFPGPFKNPSAGDVIRTRELLRDRTLNPAPLTWLGNPCVSENWRVANAPQRSLIRFTYYLNFIGDEKTSFTDGLYGFLPGFGTG